MFGFSLGTARHNQLPSLCDVVQWVYVQTIPEPGAEFLLMSDELRTPVWGPLSPLPAEFPGPLHKLPVVLVSAFGSYTHRTNKLPAISLSSATFLPLTCAGESTSWHSPAPIPHLQTVKQFASLKPAGSCHRGAVAPAGLISTPLLSASRALLHFPGFPSTN